MERWNRMMKNIMWKYFTEYRIQNIMWKYFTEYRIQNITWKYFTANNTHKYIDVLSSVVEKYNNTHHRSIKLKPTDTRKLANYNTYIMHYAKVNARKATLPKFHVGDRVRIVRKNGTFEKGFTPNWTDEVFTITTVKATKLPTYTIEDTRREPV